MGERAPNDAEVERGRQVLHGVRCVLPVVGTEHGLVPITITHFLEVFGKLPSIRILAKAGRDGSPDVVAIELGVAQPDGVRRVVGLVEQADRVVRHCGAARSEGRGRVPQAGPSGIGGVLRTRIDTGNGFT